MSDSDMAFAVGRLVEIGGGILAVEDGRVLAACPLPVAGLLSDAPLADVIAQSRACNEAARGSAGQAQRRSSPSPSSGSP